MLNRILVSLICIVVLFLSACQSSASTLVPTESSTNPPSKTDNNPTPTFTPIPNDNPLPPAEDTQLWEAMREYVHDGLSGVQAWPLIMDSVHNHIEGSYTQLYRRLVGAYLIAIQQYPNIRSDIAKTVGKTRRDLLPALNDFFDTAESDANADALAKQAQTELGFIANSPAPTFHPSDFDPATSSIFNPLDTSDETTINIAMINQHPASDFEGLTAEVTGSVFDANSWQAQPEAPITISSPISVNRYGNLISFKVGGAVDWANIVLKKNGQVVGYYLAAKGPLGFQHLMTMRPMTVTQEGRDLMPSDSWGSPELTPTSTTSTNSDQLKAEWQQKLSDALDKAVAIGDITQDEEDTLLGNYDDDQLAYLSPPLRAGLLLSASIKQTAGDILRPVLLGTFNNDGPLPNYIIDDPNLLAVLKKHNVSAPPSNFDPNRVQRYEFNDDHSQIILWGSAYHNESIEGIASLMPHELLAHNDMAASYTEEVFANGVQALAWAVLLNRDLASGNPTIFNDVTYDERLNNELWLALYNSTYVPEDGSPPLSYIGIMSRITGEQTHDQKTYNVLPGSNTSYKSFYEYIVERYKKNTGGSWPDYSPGSEATRQLFMAMFNLSDQESDQLLQKPGLGHFDKTTGHYDPDYSELLFSNVMDKLAHQPFSDEMVIRVAQALHVTLDGSSATH